ncbi:MAG: hypothetical protein KDA31_01600 [Phycisphaerales bacterium]|nr:hypothetical protein [Phycisphaerales bacterium]MCB9835200.1 hypothetical protein [Phycisphaera sp.]
MRSIAITLPVALLVTGCARHHHFQPSLNITETMTDSSIGAGQGDTVIDNMLVLYGDAETGVAQFYAMDALPPSEPVHTIRLTKDGIDLIQHPTGFTHHPELGTYIGNTVNSVGTIFSVDLDKAIAEGDLDNAITRITDDDLAVNGTRPEFVRYEDQWLIATADYGDTDNQLRLYNPAILSKRTRTSIDKILVKSFPCPPFVQTLEWIDDLGVLVLVQNQTKGQGYRLTFCTLEESSLNQLAVIDLNELADELEGFVVLGDGRFVMVSSSPEGNVHLGEIKLPRR